jgi:hypothetical protein
VQRIKKNDIPHWKILKLHGTFLSSSSRGPCCCDREQSKNKMSVCLRKKNQTCSKTAAFSSFVRSVPRYYKNNKQISNWEETGSDIHDSESLSIGTSSTLKIVLLEELGPLIF